LFALLFGIISLLYATVGQAGGTAFLALMALASFPASEMRPTALALNIVAATYSTWAFNRNKAVDWQKLGILLASSMPAALLGGLIVLDERIYKTTTGVVLLIAGAVMILRRRTDLWPDRRWRRCLPGAGDDRITVGLAKTNSRIVGAFHPGQFVRRPDRNPFGRTGGVVPSHSVRRGNTGRCHYRNRDRLEMAGAGADQVHPRRHPFSRRDAIDIFLTIV
jgi:hypothetical protein